MSQGYSIEDLSLMLEEESADYVLLHKIDIWEIEDRFARNLAFDARDALERFEAYVRDHR